MTPAQWFSALADVQRLWPIFGEPWPYTRPSLPLLSPWRSNGLKTERLDLFGEQWAWAEDHNGVETRWAICTGRKQFEWLSTKEQADARLEELGWILVAGDPS